MEKKELFRKGQLQCKFKVLDTGIFPRILGLHAVQTRTNITVFDGHPGLMLWGDNNDISFLKLKDIEEIYNRRIRFDINTCVARAKKIYQIDNSQEKMRFYFKGGELTYLEVTCHDKNGFINEKTIISADFNEFFKNFDDEEAW
jgi:hypothetical protein